MPGDENVYLKALQIAVKEADRREHVENIDERAGRIVLFATPKPTIQSGTQKGVRKKKKTSR